MKGLIPCPWWFTLISRNGTSPNLDWMRGVVLMLGLCVAAMVHSAPVTAGDLVSVPVRWCAVKGSRPVTEPATTTDGVLLNRLARISNNIYIKNRALSPDDAPRITFRSAIPTEIRFSTSKNFPVIDDPFRFSGDDEGEVIHPEDEESILGRTGADREWFRLYIACDNAWKQQVRDTAHTIPVPINLGRGITAINVRGVRRLMKDPMTGKVTLAGLETFRGFGGTLNTGITHPHVTVTDIDLALPLVNADNPHVVDYDTLLAHEMGHALGESHLTFEATNALGGGMSLTVKNNVMCNGDFTKPMNSCQDQVTLFAQQAARLRVFAQKIGNLDPPATIIPGPIVADFQVDALGDVPASEAFIDLAEFMVRRDLSTGLTAFTHILPIVMPLDITLSNTVVANYWALADLDNNPSTGGSAADLFSLGVPPMAFGGVELVTRVQMRRKDGNAVATLWRFDAGSFTEVLDASIRATRETIGAFDTAATFDAISIEFADGVMGFIVQPFRMQAVTENSETGTIDQLDESSPGEGTSVFLNPNANFPTCEVSPATAPAASPVSVAFEGLLPNSNAQVIFGEIPVGSGLTDASGNGLFPFLVPPSVRGGLHLVTVRSEGTALTADCGITVSSTPQLCDVNRDGLVNRDDINAIFAARNTPAAPGDPRDANGDGQITVEDARLCALRCTNPGCAP